MTASPHAIPVTAPLAAFVARCGWADLPSTVRHEARRALLNYFAVACAGAPDPTLDIAHRVYARFGARPEAGLVGRPGRLDRLNAAALNAMAANVYDFDDTHHPTIIHPTAPVAAALFAQAQAEARPVRGTDFLLAFVLGVETECRVGNAVSPAHYARGWHITSTCGVFGAAMGVGKLLNLEPRQLGWALGTASGQAGGLVETLGTMSKSVSVGNAARNGLLSALLAREGFSGPDHPLEGERGFLRVTCETPDFDSITRGLGEHWELLSNTYKPYPCGVVLNPVLDACLALHRDTALAEAGGLAAVRTITLAGHPLLRQRTDRPGVRTGRESQVSAQHAVAAALSRGRAGLAEFSDEAVHDPALQALGAKVHMVDDPRFAVDAVELRLGFAGGTEIVHRVDAARGSLARPLSDADLEDKLRTLYRHGIGPEDPQALIDAVWGLEDTPDAGALMRRLERRVRAER